MLMKMISPTTTLFFTYLTPLTLLELVREHYATHASIGEHTRFIFLMYHML